MIRAKYLNTPNAKASEMLLSNEKGMTVHLEIPNVVRSTTEFDKTTLRNRIKQFLKLYSEFVKIFGEDHGGMSCMDLFSFWYTLDIIKPTVVIQSSVSKGYSYWFVRKTVPKAMLFCIDPNVPQYIDKSKDTSGNDLTKYFVGENYKNFKDMNFKDYGVTQSQLSEECLVFFDDHTNSLERLKQVKSLGVKHIMFNNNYPAGCGGHLTLQHIKSDTDDRFSTFQEREQYRQFVTMNVERETLFPNVVGDRVQTGEGTFTVRCLFKDFNELETKLYHNTPEPDLLESFKDQSLRYRWNSYIKLR
jgi:hypothetical protein